MGRTGIAKGARRGDEKFKRSQCGGVPRRVCLRRMSAHHILAALERNKEMGIANGARLDPGEQRALQDGDDSEQEGCRCEQTSTSQTRVQPVPMDFRRELIVEQAPTGER